MNRCVNQRLISVTRIACCALSLLVISGCAAFENVGSLSTLLQSNTPVDASEDSIGDDDAVAEALIQPDSESAHPVLGSAAPEGRLLTPDFGSNQAEDETGSSGGHSLAPATLSDTEDVYAEATRPASQARALFDPPAPQNESSSDPHSVKSMEQTVDAMSFSHPEIRSAHGGQPSVEQVSAEAVGAEIPQPADPANAAPERSVLDRLRGLAPDRNTGDRLLRQFERLPNPLDLWQDRDAEEPPAQTAEVIPEVKPLPAPEESIASAADSGDLLRALIELLEQELDAWPQTESGSALQPDEYRRRQLNLRLLRLVADEPAAAAEAINAATAEEQEFWQELVLALSRFRSPDESVDYEEHIAATIGQFRMAIRQLEPLSSLAIPRLEFCSGIDSFGSIDTFPSNTFKPGERLLIYAEIDNLQSEVSPLGSYRTSFSGTVQIWPDASTSPEKWIKSEPFETFHDDSSTRRSDYFMNYEFNLPEHLAPGAYEVRLLLRDEISGRTTRASRQFSVQ